MRRMCFSTMVLAAFIGNTPSVFAEEPAAVVTSMPGLVAFWDFVKREPDGLKRFTAHVPKDSPTDYPLDAANYIREYWGP